MCKSNGKSVDHFLLHFNVASAIYSVFSVVLGCPGLCLDILLICTTVGVLWQVKECCGVENGVYVLLLVFVEGNE
jgi:hypothetical protein